MRFWSLRRNRFNVPYSKAPRFRQMTSYMPKGLTRAFGAMLALVALYSLLGFLIIPGVGLRIANQQLAQYATVPAHLQRIEFNPFSLELTLWGLQIGEPGKEQVGFERLYANLSLDSLWTKALHLEAVELDKPRNEVLFAKDGSLNLTQLFKLPPSEPKPEEPAGDPFPAAHRQHQAQRRLFALRDLRPSEPIEFLYDSMNTELKNLSTLPDDNADMALVAIGPNGGRIDWSGTLSLAPIASEGTLKVTEGRMKAFWPYVRDAVPWCWKKAWSAWTLTTSSICPRKPSCCWTTPRCASPPSPSRHRTDARWRVWPVWT